MHSCKSFLLVLMLLLVAVPGEAAGSGTSPRLRIEGPRNNTLALTVRGVKDSIEPIVRIDGKRAGIVTGSQKLIAEGTLFFEVDLPDGLKPGKVPLEVAVGGEILTPEPLFEIPDPLVAAGKQPLILKVEPAGGLPSATIKITGKNFGEDLAKVYIVVGPIQTKVLPVSISRPDDQGVQEMIFAIPPRPKGRLSAEERGKNPFLQILSYSSICNYALLAVGVSNRASNWQILNVVHPEGLWKVAGLSLALVFILMSPLLAVCCWRCAVAFVVLLGGYLTFALRSDLCVIFAVVFSGVALGSLLMARLNQDTLRPIVRTMFMDKETETYSLSKVQAFAWTVVVIASYVYFAVGRGILVGRTEIPDLNAGLLGLLTISYGGLIASRGISRRRPKNDFVAVPPRWTNLITEGSSISITRLQLIGFTIAGIAVYVFYISGIELFFEGLPDIPPTLNGLLAVSQGGYLGGKIVNDTAVNYVTPRRARAAETITLFGVGFLDKTRVLVQGAPDAIESEFVNSSSLKVKLPAAMGDLGLKQMVFIPPTGASFVVSEAFELIEPEVLDLKTESSGQVSFTLKGIQLGETELRASMGGKPLAVIKKEGGRVTLESRDDVAAGAVMSLKTADGDDIASVVIG
jgi:hypothetical protein